MSSDDKNYKQNPNLPDGPLPNSPAEKSPERVDFERVMKELSRPITLEELEEILSITIKGEDPKVMLFLISLLTYTDHHQTNAMILGESSIGKTNLENEIIWFFRKDASDEDIIVLSGASPKSIIHQANAVLVDGNTMEPIDWSKAPKKGDSNEDRAKWSAYMRNSAWFLDFSNKILVFPDQPDTKLLETLRPLLSHDQRFCKYQIVEKQSGGIRTKTVIIKGFFTCIYATAATQLNHQEVTRFWELSISDKKEKIDEVLDLQAEEMSNPEWFKIYETDPRRVFLKERVETIKEARINTILIPQDLMNDLKIWYKSKVKGYAPKKMRDFKRLAGLARAWALLNYSHREGNRDVRFCNAEDIAIAKRLYAPIAEQIDLGLSAEELEILDILKPHMSTTEGISIAECHKLYHNAKKRTIDDERLRGMLKNLCHSSFREDKENKKFVYYLTSDNEKTEVQQELPTEVSDQSPKMALDKPSKICAVCNKPIDGIAEHIGKLNELAHLDCALKWKEENGLGD